jgi:hypothetical protein
LGDSTRTRASSRWPSNRNSSRYGLVSADQLTHADKQFSVKIIFERGKNQTDETKPETVARSLRTSDDKVVEFRNEKFSRECTFFINKNGEV